MALFTDDAPPSGEHPHRSGRAGRAGWIVLGVALTIGLILGVTPSPYVIEKPGPVFNTIGTAKHNGTETPLITIPGQTVHPTEGSLDLLTVSLVGTPDNRPSWLKVAGAWLDPSQAVIPIDVAFPPSVTTKQRDDENQAMMVNSQQDAIAAALTNLGYDYPTVVSVVSLPKDSPAKGIMKAGDQVVSVNGAAVADIAALRKALKSNGTEAAASIGILREGKALTVQVAPVKSSGAVVVGINVTTSYEFPFDVKIQLDRVGGPSAGMMFALGIIDKLTPGAIQGGANVAGTGTIDQAGTVGPIGGIRQKLEGASEAGVDWFLAPADNCNEVTGHIPGGLKVFAVKTLDDSLAVLDAIRTDGDLSRLPTCPAG
ncbi:PDZ domain-containing protein [Cryobacterium algoritolerans]|uniref:endopeptidase La n=1 Tax=Cryobacterium algoritolerans TaxID=1259184 RepID=A0A4R8WL56_9MICO|nr:S16 family serine protease [Cryobacterium algoritolerans]TFC09834.1 PDZ domain-containing protein [Cryobacterium algoritolerans]